MGEDKKQDTSQKDRNEALNCLRDICANGGKDSDRISAAKLLLEYERVSTPVSRASGSS